ncbi:endonuclease/exonuclease/phosphatase family protein [Gemmatimonadota bacterium]
MKRLLIVLPMVAALALGACGDDDPTGPEDPAPQEFVVLSWNVYVGADLTQLLAIEDPAQIACGVGAVYDDVLATEFETRARAIADQIAAQEPLVIGLNEVSTFDFAGNTVHEDLVFLDVLLDELTARGLNYAAPEAARSMNFEISLPISYAVDCAPQDLVSYSEYDVLLVQGDLGLDGADNGRFAQPLPLPFGLDPKYSGWAYVDLQHESSPYRVFTTHLEPGDTGPCETNDPGLLFVHTEQAAELMQILDESPYPIILTGDLNSDASGCTTPTYPALIGAGFVDAWSEGSGIGSGFTANEDGDLRNETSALYHRIDFVLYRDESTVLTGEFPGSVDVDLLGEDPADRIATTFGYLVWPSDHAGVLAGLTFVAGS